MYHFCTQGIYRLTVYTTNYVQDLNQFFTKYTHFLLPNTVPSRSIHCYSSFYIDLKTFFAVDTTFLPDSKS